MFSILIPYQCSTFHSPSTLSDAELHDHLHHLDLGIHITCEHMAQVLHHIVDQLTSRWTPAEDGETQFLFNSEQISVWTLNYFFVIASQMDEKKLEPNILWYGYSNLFWSHQLSTICVVKSCFMYFGYLCLRFSTRKIFLNLSKL